MSPNEKRQPSPPQRRTPSDQQTDVTSSQDSRLWHTESAETVRSTWQTGPDGLDESAVKRLQSEYGPNIYKLENGNTLLKRLAAQLNNLLIFVLLAAALVTMLTGHQLDAVVILAVVVLNVVIGLYQEGKAEKSLQAIQKMLAPKAQVMRNARLITLDAEELVPGDLLVVASGDNLPADVRFVETVNLQVDESALTGESVPVTKQIDPVAADASLGDQLCMGFSGTLVTQGNAKAIVVRTGMQTEMGRIGRMLKEVQSTKTPLVQNMETFSRWLTVFILGFATCLFAYGHWIIGMALPEAFMAVVGLAVAAIPEGLPAILTITMAIGVQSMVRRRAIVRRLPAVETLGSVTVICSDKTGTLTRNEMTVQSVVTTDQTLEVSGTGYAPQGEISIVHGDNAVQAAPNPSASPGNPVSRDTSSGSKESQPDSPGLTLIGLTSALCNEAALQEEPDGNWTLTGDPTEGALLTLAMKLGLDLTQIRKESPRIAHMPFESEHRFMATVHRASDLPGSGGTQSESVILLKGAPDKVLTLCTDEMGPDGVGRDLDMAYWNEQIEQQASQGRRVLGFAFRPDVTGVDQKNIHTHARDLTFVGIVGIMDPPRDEAIEAIDKCHRAGIRVKMITGDHAGTALAIARSLHIGTGERAMTGAELERLDEQALREVVREVDVFARASPEHKIRLVRALQANGEVVAMTGDGVNDSPALKQADIGIAMGLKGTEAAKQAAEIVLTDDNFASIVNAVEEGRTIYDNLKKSISFLLPINGGESMAIGLAILLGLALPITPLQLLWINMVSSIGLAMVLAFEPAEPGIMSRAPRDRHDPLISRFLIWRILFVSTLFLCGIFGLYNLTLAQGADIDTARTVAVNALVCMEVFYLFSVRYLKAPSFTWIGIRGTPRVLGAVGLVVALQVIMTYTPFMQTWFATTPLSVGQLGMIVAAGVALLVILELEKLVTRRSGKPATRHT